jgi:elongation factor Ts
MAVINAALVKALRDKTGVGMMDCKKALVATNGDFEAAIESLRASSTLKAAKKAERVAAKGLVGLVVERRCGAMAELNAETDFVARSPIFQKAAAALAPIALDVRGDHDRLLNAPSPDGDGKVSDLITRMTATIGEHINLRRCAFLSIEQGHVASYVHSAVTPGLGGIGVLVAIASDADADSLLSFGRQIAMHVAASAPQWVAVADIPADVVAAKRIELTTEAQATGKPPQVVEKMIEGRLRKFYDEVVLTRQPFVLNLDQTVDQAIRQAEEMIGTAIAIEAFARLRTGEGIEKPAD